MISFGKFPVKTDGGGNYSVIVPVIGRDTLVKYTFQAEDERGNIGEINGSYIYVPQTDFESPILNLVTPPQVSTSEEPTKLVVNVTDVSAIKNISFKFYANDTKAWYTAPVKMDDYNIFSVMVPIVTPGTTVEYIFEAEDDWGNKGIINGTYNTTGETFLYISLDENQIFGGEPILLRGVTYPAEINVTLCYSHEEICHNFTLISNEVGSFNQSFKPTSMGIWGVHAYYEGDKVYLPVSSKTLNFTVDPVSSNITCELSTDTVEYQRSITITGKFSIEQEGVPIKLYYKKDDKIVSTLNFTSQNGSYEVEFTPESKGLWLIKAKVNTDGLIYNGTESEYVGLKVLNPTLTTLLLRVPSGIIQKTRGLFKSPLLFGVLGIVGVAGGGIFFYLRSRE